MEKSSIQEKLYLYLFSFIPLSIVLGPSISLANILIIDLIFLVNLFFIKNFKLETKYEITLFFIIYLYLICNSFISISFQEGALRNFGFLRFIIIFCTINYFFHTSKNTDRIFNIWSITIFIVVLDSIIEFTFGKNLLGYGDQLYSNRIVSFFKDEPIVGGYLLGFVFIVSGFYFDKFINKSLKYKLILTFIILVLFGCILITGERSNGIKAIIGLTLFIFLNKNIKFNSKIFLLFLSIIISSLIIFNSSYLKIRYGQQLFTQIFDKNQREKFIENNIYLKLYKSGFAIFKDHPIFGVGNKNYRVITTQNIETKANDQYMLNTHPHQIYIELLSEHGLVGSLILLSIFFTLIFKNLKIIILSRNSVQLGCLIYLIINFLPILPSGSFFNDFSLTLFWLNLSILYACNKQTNIFSKY
ncbi:O-antigen ligase family protein [Pelagibacterales bacterium SAG-MED15]|nr:O-antigen ligase family protein [Pelagibacterales bacterium SAG-MED15]